jgi:asparagine synthase (glutamine-hydrolysing)
MSAAMVHRGPDDSGLEIIRHVGKHSLILAHRRLSILDLSLAGHQPMHDPETGNWIVYNGEVYNFAALRKELESLGHRFESQCDTEVILKGYAAWGEEVLPRLRGMFAFAIYDATRRIVLLARDRFGIKPLYYCPRPVTGVPLIFASEVRALLASELVSRRLSQAGVASYLTNGYVPAPLTILEHTHALLPGWYMVVDSAGRVIEQRAYWKWTGSHNGRERFSGHRAARHIRSVLEDTVAQHLVSDVPLGVFLSGGLDSSALVALMAGVSSRLVETFSLTFDDPNLNEQRYARAVAERFRARHHEAHINERECISLINYGLAALDQPTTDGLNSYIVSRKCREAGLTVAIAGTGGDELFGGYSSFCRVPWAMWALHAFHRLPRRFRRPVGLMLSQMVAGSNSHLPSAGVRGKVAALLDLPPDPLAVFQLSRAVLLPRLCGTLLGNSRPPLGRFGIPQPLEGIIRSAVNGSSDVREQISLFEQACYLSNQLLRDTDAVSMAVSLEVRVPFLDHVLVETVSSVDPRARFGGARPKQLLIDAVRDLLPPEVYRRKKQGFVLPMGRWLFGPLSSLVSDILNDTGLMRQIGLVPEAVQTVWRDCRRAGGRVFFNRLWSLVVLGGWCRWHRTFVNRAAIACTALAAVY